MNIRRAALSYLLLIVALEAQAQSSPEKFKGDWITSSGRIYSTCTFGLNNKKITQQCGSGSNRTLEGAKFSGKTITLPKIFLGTSDEGYTVLIRNGNSLNGRYIRSDGVPGPTGTFVKQ
jgi:hypothetical protein